jgi:hypothetical protein
MVFADDDSNLIQTPTERNSLGGFESVRSHHFRYGWHWRRRELARHRWEGKIYDQHREADDRWRTRGKEREHLDRKGDNEEGHWVRCGGDWDHRQRFLCTSGKSTTSTSQTSVTIHARFVFAILSCILFAPPSWPPRANPRGRICILLSSSPSPSRYCIHVHILSLVHALRSVHGFIPVVCENAFACANVLVRHIYQLIQSRIFLECHLVETYKLEYTVHP